MLRTIKKHLVEIILVFCIAVSFTVFSTPKLTSRYLHRPPGTVFVGMPGYFEDYYYYLDQFEQGREGRWLTENRFSIERFPPTLIYFNNILFGHIGSLFGWESFTSYNVAGVLFKFLFILSGYALIRKFFPDSLINRIGTFLVFLYSTSLSTISVTNGAIVLNAAVDIFRSENRAMARFGTSPSGMFINFIFLVVFLFLIDIVRQELQKRQSTEKIYSSKQAIVRWLIAGGICILFTLMAIGDDVKSLLLVFVIFVVMIYETRSMNFLKRAPKTMLWVTIFGAISIITAAYLYKTVNVDPVYNEANTWDIQQYWLEAASIRDGSFFTGFGLQLPFFIIGYFVVLYKKQRSLFENIGLILAGSATLGYIIPMILKIPIPGFRLIFPATYAFMSVFVLYAMRWIGEKSKNSHVFVTLLILYLFINGVSFFRSWYVSIQIPKEPDYHFAYIPDDLYKGLLFLRTAEPRDGNVLASAYSSIDLMIPGIAGRYTYSGHFFTTYHSKEKDTNVNKFFFEWVETPGLHTFLEKNNIRFVVATKYDETKALIHKYYPFLKVVFENPAITIYRYDP